MMCVDLVLGGITMLGGCLLDIPIEWCLFICRCYILWGSSHHQSWGAAFSLFTPVVAVYLIPLRVGAGIVLGCMMQNISAK